MQVKVIDVGADGLKFTEGYSLCSYHSQDCCEDHFLEFTDLSLEDFEGLYFDLDNPETIRKIPDFGIELIPIKGWGIKIPGYGWNNGYYSDQLEIIISQNNKEIKTIDITDCQAIAG